MPTVMREGAWAVIIYPDDHAPPHVHVKLRGVGEVKVSIPAPGEYVAVLRVRDLATHQAMRAVRLVETHREHLLREWEDIHGRA